MCTYLHTRGRRYYFRRAVPVELAPFILTASGQPRLEWMVSLGTSDRATAKRLIPEHTIRTEAMLTEARAKAALAPASTPTNALRRRSRFAPNRDGPTPQEQEVMALFDRKAEQQEWRYEDRRHARNLLEQRFRGTTASLSPMEAAARDLVRDAKYEAMVATERDNIARSELTELKASVSAPAPVDAVDRTKGTMLETIISRWFAERKVTAKTRDAATAAVRWFYERVGPVAVEQITRRDMLDFKDKLLADGTSIPNTKMKLSRISGLLGYALDNDLIPVNYAKGITILDPQASTRKPKVYSSEALATLFAGPVHAAGARPAQGRGQASYWLPLLALYTGARLEELGQLRPGDVREQTYLDGDDKPQTAWIISITEDEADGLHLKNAGSIRVVPVHPALVELGFIKLIQEAAAKKQARVFSGLTPDKYGNYTAKWSMWFSGYKKEQGLIDPRLKFHSFRHTFKDNARHLGMIEGIQRQIMGHSGEAVADEYGSGHSLYRLVEAMKTYRVPGFILPLPHC